MSSGIPCFWLQLLCAAPQHKPVYWQWYYYRLVTRISKLFKRVKKSFWCFVLSFQYVSKLCHWLLQKRFKQLFYLIFTVAYKLLQTTFTKVHLHWINNISTPKCAVYTPSRWYMWVDLFCICYLTFSLSLHFIHVLSIVLIYWMLSKSAFRINGAMNWYWPLWNFNNFSF